MISGVALRREKAMSILFYVIFFGLAGVIGLWAFACLLSALVKRGPFGLISDYFSAITGKKPSAKGEDKKDM